MLKCTGMACKHAGCGNRNRNIAGPANGWNNKLGTLFVGGSPAYLGDANVSNSLVKFALGVSILSVMLPFKCKFNKTLNSVFFK